MLDFIRIACAVPAVKVGDVYKNAEDICRFMEQADAQDVDLLVLPELALTGYTCGDLFYQDMLYRAVATGLARILECSAEHSDLTVAVGLPVRLGGKLYNCAAVISGGEVDGLVAKTHIPGAEKRWFTSGQELDGEAIGYEELGLTGSGELIPIGTGELFRVGDAVVGVEICQDLLAPIPVSSQLAVHGAEVIVNLSASPEIAGKSAYRRDLVRHQSQACNCIYAYVSAGRTESTTDQVFCGQSLVGENGKILAERSGRPETDYLLVTDCDLGRVRADRLRNPCFDYAFGGAVQASCRSDGSLYPLRKLPFIPDQKLARQQRCNEIFDIQVAGLKQRLATIGANAVIGISGGLDSTLALLVAVEAMRQLGRPMTDVYGVTMPCFGTSDRTYNNAWELMKKLGIHAKEINIKSAVNQHFADIGHDPAVHNATYENSQARERTQILMDYASVVGGIVVGTGDLSELALGWCTYNGDHMSMYGVNASVPKTLIRWIVETVADRPEFVEAKEVLLDVLDTPISPELLPPDAEGKISQQTEDLVGPYALHDFFLYYFLRYGFSPEKIYTLACRAFREDFDAETVKKWLKTFCRRFFTQQFKRNCVPDGVSVGSIGLSPRCGWVMPSDAAGRVWLEEAESL